ncbi:hypothetical protein PHLCEN_2v13677 [Hermanssonia centrifuga]|uniref:Cytochrome P450 n=1 Tax=Hermanssonia centrifuga TaxID=98765 RepID=A0A2R6NDN8_9APHY|nr:hypothetical protein PHLCEN_2v13677 [Hermanssonia centrifuga]
MASLTVVDVVALLIALFLLANLCKREYQRRTGIKRSARLPPGPSAIPLIGNVHQLPTEYQEKTFFEWGRQYGGIVYAQLFRNPAIVINSVKVARDLMERRSANYSDRPIFTLLEELLGWKCMPTQMQYGERYRKHRKWMQDTFLSKPVLLSYQPIQRREIYILLSRLSESPELFETHIRGFVAALLMEIVYGHKILSLEDEYVELAERAGTESVLVGSPGSGILSLLVDFFPVLKHYPLWLPGSGFKVKTNYIKGLVTRFLNDPYNMVKEKMTAGTLTAFILAGVVNPGVFKKAQEEIDRVIGNDRLPDFEDRKSLPYMECVLKELYRWDAAAVLGLPHRSMAEDVYQGYRIPRGSMIIPNIWGMSRDPVQYPDPEEFLPERFVDSSKPEADDYNPRNFVFGFGRRQCPGQLFADGNVYLVMSNIIATMDISRAKDEDGCEIITTPEFTSGLVRHPKKFQCVIKPRSEKAINLIARMNLSV